MTGLVNRHAINASAVALWVRRGAVLGLATALATPAGYGYQQFATAVGDASVTVTLVANRTLPATATGLARGLSAVQVEHTHAGVAQGDVSASSYAAPYSDVQATALGEGSAYGSVSTAQAIGEVWAVPTATLIQPAPGINGSPSAYLMDIGGAGAYAGATAFKIQFLTATGAMAEATGQGEASVVRWGFSTDNLALVDWTRAEASLMLAAENGVWDDGEFWDDGGTWGDAGFYRHDGYVLGPAGTATGTVEDARVNVIGTAGPYGFSQAYSSVTGHIIHPGALSVTAEATTALATTYQTTALQGTASASASVVLATGVRNVRPTVTATADATSSPARVAINYAARAATTSGTSLSGGAVPVRIAFGHSSALADASSTLTPARQHYGAALATGAATSNPVAFLTNYAGRVSVTGGAAASGNATWANGYFGDVAATATATATATAWAEYWPTPQADATATGNATPATQHYAEVLTSGEASREPAPALMDYAAQVEATGTATGRAEPATQYYAELLGAAAGTGQGAALMNYAAQVLTLATASGSGLGFANSDVLAPDCRYLTILAEDRTLLAEGDDRLFTVTCS